MTNQDGDPGTTNQDADEDITSEDWNKYMNSQNGNVHSGDLSEKCPKRFMCFNIWFSVGYTDGEGYGTFRRWSLAWGSMLKGAGLLVL